MAHYEADKFFTMAHHKADQIILWLKMKPINWYEN